MIPDRQWSEDVSRQSAVGSFLTSPGFGGVMATAAAGIAQAIRTRVRSLPAGPF